MGRIIIGLLILLQTQTSHQFFANLCFNRARTLDCSLEARAYMNGTMKVSSVTLLLSSNEDRLRANNDGLSCSSVEIECQTTVRETKRDEFDASLLAVNDYIKSTCDGKMSCNVVIPDWRAVDGTSNDCAKRFNTQKFHLRGVYLDVGCELPVETTTTAATTANMNNGSTTNTTTDTSIAFSNTTEAPTGNTLTTTRAVNKKSTTDRKEPTVKPSFLSTFRPRKSIDIRGDKSASQRYGQSIGVLAILLSMLLLL